MTNTKNEQQKSELEQALGTFRGYHHAHHRRDPNILFGELWDWAQALTKDHPFLHAEKSEKGDVFTLDIRLGTHTEGRLTVNLITNGRDPLFHLFVEAPDTLQTVKIKSELNSDLMFFTKTIQNEEELRFQPGLLNMDYLDYLLAGLLNYLIEQIEPYKFTSAR